MKSYLSRITEALLQPSRRRQINTLDIGSPLQTTEIPFSEFGIVVLHAGLAFIEVAQVEAEEDGTTEADQLQGDVHSHGRTVVWPVLPAVGVRGPDTGGVAKGVDEGVRGGTLGRGTGDCV